ncbi:MAG: cytidylate kinase-like family protein [Clostridiales Family XIII bacterium]|jgi:cytidylate kinase|nr:cytidylate kinase-like family protein [Clostridiales Family XIII bacterium]
MKNIVITIARSFGSGGKEIGLELANRLGISCYDREILKMASEFSGISETLYRETDEKLRISLMRKRMHGIFNPESAIPSSPFEDFTSDDALFRFQASIIRDLANSESCVIVGRCADKILARKNNVLKVYIRAPIEQRTAAVMHRLHIGENEARALIAKTDRYRRDYYKYYSGGSDWTDPDNYSMILNSALMGRDACVALLEIYIRDIFGKRS